MNLNEWLDDTAKQDGTITLYDGTVSNFRLMVEKCEQAGLIAFDSVDSRLNITYRRIQAAEPAPTGDAVADNGADGDSLVSGNTWNVEWGTCKIVGRGKTYHADGKHSAFGLKDILNEYDFDILALRTELSRAQAHAAALEARIGNLQSRMDDIAEHARIALDDGDGAIMEAKLETIRMLADND